MSQAELERRAEHIDRVARELGLDPFPTRFETLPANAIHELQAYGLPDRYSHWTFGQQYRDARISQDSIDRRDFGIVINAEPAQAYLYEGNSLPRNTTAIAHMLGHVDFYRHNRCFRATRRDMPYIAQQAREQVTGHEEKAGTRVVESFLDAALSIEEYPEILEFIRDHAPHLNEWQRDILDVVIRESLYFRPQRQTAILNEGWACFWQMRIMHVLSEQGLIDDAEMTECILINAQMLDPRYSEARLLGLVLLQWVADFYNGEVSPTERSWLEEQNLAVPPRHEGTFSGSPGQHKLLEIRDNCDDVSLVQEHFNKIVNDRIRAHVGQKEPDQPAVWFAPEGLAALEGRLEAPPAGAWSLGRREEALDGDTGPDRPGGLAGAGRTRPGTMPAAANGSPKWSLSPVDEDEWVVVKDILLRELNNGGLPVVEVMDRDDTVNKGLHLKHWFDGRELDLDSVEKNLKQVYVLSGGPVRLETIVRKAPAVISYDGKEVSGQGPGVEAWFARQHSTPEPVFWPPQPLEPRDNADAAKS